MGFHLRLAALSASGRRYAPASAAHLIYVNTLMGTGNYSATSKIGTLAVTFGTAARRGLGGAPTSPGPPYCTKCCRVFQSTFLFVGILRLALMVAELVSVTDITQSRCMMHSTMKSDIQSICRCPNEKHVRRTVSLFAAVTLVGYPCLQSALCQWWVRGGRWKCGSGKCGSRARGWKMREWKKRE